MTAVGVALSRACEDGDITVRPKMPFFTENNMKDRYLTDAEEAAIFRQIAIRVGIVDVIDLADVGYEYRYIGHLATFLLDTGFRFSEAFKFTLADGRAHLLHGSTKSGKGRRVPLTPRALASAKYLLSSEHHKSLKTRGETKSWAWCSHRWNIITKAAGCPDVTLHILRHTCASRLVQRGVEIYVVSKWLGHSSVKMTERYAKLAPDTFEAALAALER
jgi:integrase